MSKCCVKLVKEELFQSMNIVLKFLGSSNVAFYKHTYVRPLSRLIKLYIARDGRTFTYFNNITMKYRW